MKKINILQLKDSNLSSMELMALHGKGLKEPYTCACMVGDYEEQFINTGSIYGTIPVPPPGGGGSGGGDPVTVL